MNWDKKLNFYLTFDLQSIHSNDIIHRDLHSGNILQDDLYNAYIGDLDLQHGLIKESGGIYGAIPYIAPEVLQGKPFTRASDIYSFGMIMWEISSGKFVFSDHKGDNLESIIFGLRLSIFKSTSTCYVKLLKKCWDENQTVHEIIVKEK